jgi:predicted hotdog family 3-hydroxylacyl-ACP dehydratase
LLIEKEELQTLIPHRGKMLLLNRCTGYDVKDRSICVEYDITEDCLFYDPVLKGIPTWAGFEFMAQAISVLSGLRGREIGEKPKIGFILSIPSMQMKIPFLGLGNTAKIRVKEYDCTSLIYTFEGEIVLGENKVMEGKLMVMEVSDEQQFLKLMKEYS